jgi:hypothetical protein
MRVDLNKGMNTEAILATRLPERVISISSGLMLTSNFPTFKNGASSFGIDPV